MASKKKSIKSAITKKAANIAVGATVAAKVIGKATGVNKSDFKKIGNKLNEGGLITKPIKKAVERTTEAIVKTNKNQINANKQAVSSVIGNNKGSKVLKNTASKKDLLNTNQQSSIQKQKDAYAKAQKAGDTAGMKKAHEAANKIRESAGLKAGKDYNATDGSYTKSYTEKAKSIKTAAKKEAGKSNIYVPQSKKSYDGKKKNI